jgi:hypothetical protein
MEKSISKPRSDLGGSFDPGESVASLKGKDSSATQGKMKLVDQLKAKEEGAGSSSAHREPSTHGRRVMTFGGPGNATNKTDYVASIKNEFKVGGGDKKGIILAGPEARDLNMNQLKARTWRKPYSYDDRTQGQKRPFGSEHNPVGFQALPIANPTRKEIKRLATDLFIEMYGSHLPQKEPHEFKVMKEWIERFWPEVSGQAVNLLVPRYKEYKKTYGK